MAIASNVTEFAKLKIKYHATKYEGFSLDTPLFFILKKLDSTKKLSGKEYDWLSNNGFLETLDIYSEQEKQKQKEAEAKFAKLKDKYQATKYSDRSISSPLFSILEKLETETILEQSELDWLEENQLTETFSVAKKQKQNNEEVKRLENELLYLKEKYKVPKNVEYSFLHELLFKLDTENKLTNSEIKLLKYYNLNETLAIANQNQVKEFAELKIKYHATKYQDFFQDKLFRLLKKIDSVKALSTQESNWLSNNSFLEALEIYSEQEKQKEKREFTRLKRKYKVTEFADSSPDTNLYKILQKIEKVELLTEADIDWLKSYNFSQIIKAAE